MPNWNEILDELKEAGSTHDIIRRKYVTTTSDYKSEASTNETS
jgi:hypothetical protein